MERDERNLVRRLRRAATKRGLELVKPYFRPQRDVFCLVRPGKGIVLGRRFKTTLEDVARHLNVSAMALALLVMALPAGAQTFDPKPNEPGAADAAAMRFEMSLLGMTSPPVGWNCVQAVPDVTGPLYVHCEPDMALLGRQERDRQRWLEEIQKRSERLRDTVTRRRR